MSFNQWIFPPLDCAHLVDKDYALVISGSSVFCIECVANSSCSVLTELSDCTSVSPLTIWVEGENLCFSRPPSPGQGGTGDWSYGALPDFDDYTFKPLSGTMESGGQVPEPGIPPIAGCKDGKTLWRQPAQGPVPLTSISNIIEVLTIDPEFFWLSSSLVSSYSVLREDVCVVALCVLLNPK